MNQNVADWNKPVVTGNTVTLNMSAGGTRALTGGAAQAAILKLDNMETLMKVTNATTHVSEYLMLASGPNGCGFCVAATVTPTSAEGKEVVCEEGLPNCPNNPLNPTTPTINIVNAAPSVAVGKTVTLQVESNQVDPTITWTTSDAATATVDKGVVTGVKVGKATITAKLATGQQATAEVTVTAAEG